MNNQENYKFNDFNYVKDYDSIDNKAIIEHNKEKPENIYKFYSVSRLNVHALIRGYFYASHPIELNDSLDCSPFLWYTSKPIKVEQYKRLWREILSDKELKDYYE